MCDVPIASTRHRHNQAARNTPNVGSGMYEEARYGVRSHSTPHEYCTHTILCCHSDPEITSISSNTATENPMSQLLLVYPVPHLLRRVSCSYARVRPLPPVTHVTSCGYRACRCRDTRLPLPLLNRLKRLLRDRHPFPQSCCVFQHECPLLGPNTCGQLRGSHSVTAPVHVMNAQL